MFAIVVQQKMNQEIKDRDEKNVDLESKVSRLHKRAKQKIQELQKVNIVIQGHDDHVIFELASHLPFVLGWKVSLA